MAPEWCRSKAQPAGVMVPSSAWIGVKLIDDTVLSVSQSTLRRTTSFSNLIGIP